MAKKGIRIIAIATGLCADSLFYHFTAEAPRKSDKLWRTVGCLQTASPLHSSASVPATSLSLKNPLSLWTGRRWWAWQQKGEWAKPLYPLHIAGSLETEQRWLLLSMRSPFFSLDCLDSQGLFRFSAWIHSGADHCEQARDPARRLPSR